MGFIEYYAIGSLSSFVVLIGIIFGDGTIRLLFKKHDYNVAMVISLVFCSLIWPLMIGSMLKSEGLKERMIELLEGKGNE